MIKIIKITNCHIWDGQEVDPLIFNEIIRVLKISNFHHTISYYDTRNELQVRFVGNTI